jgi:hypothetical protein
MSWLMRSFVLLSTLAETPVCIHYEARMKGVKQVENFNGQVTMRWRKRTIKLDDISYIPNYASDNFYKIKYPNPSRDWYWMQPIITS